MTKLDAYKIAQDFCILDQVVNDEPLVYLDNAATTQKPQKVLDALNQYYHTINANVHRGVHTLAERATAAYEPVVKKHVNLLMPSQQKKSYLHVEQQLDLIGLHSLPKKFSKKMTKFLFQF